MSETCAKPDSVARVSQPLNSSICRTETPAQDEPADVDVPIPYVVPTEFAGRVARPAPEVASMARYMDVAKQAAREWTELDRMLVQMSVVGRREVLAFAMTVAAREP